MKYIGIWDFIWVPIYLLLLHYFANRKIRKNIELAPEYRYYKRGLLAKVYGGLAFALIYAFYYEGGDTMVYWKDAMTLNTLITSEPFCYLRILFGDMRAKWYYCFDLREHVPYHYLRDPQSYSVARLTSPFALLSIDSLLGCTILVAWFSYNGIWRLYRVFVRAYPKMKKELAIAVLFIPSTVFWGSGIMKDTFTFTAACWLTVSVYGLFLKRERVLFNSIAALVAAYIMITLKPYIFVALLPGVLMWVVFNRIQEIGNPILRVLSAPMIIMIGLVGAALIFSQASDSLGAYGSVDSIMQRAIDTQEDLKREAYEGNSFDIGTIDPSFGGLMSKAPVAIFAGLFRPTVLDVRNPLMFISALENSVLMLFLLYVFFSVGVFNFFRYILTRPMILFSFVFALFFSFAVGLTTSNFGSLVRYKIPALPFFAASLYLIRYNYRKDRLGESDDQDDDALYPSDNETVVPDDDGPDSRPPLLPKPYGRLGDTR